MILNKTPALALATLLFATAAPARAQDTLTPPVPLPPAQPPPPPAGPAALTELAARRALETGLPAIAAEIYRQLLADTPPTAAPALRNRLTLALTTALIEDDRIDEAAAALRQFSGAPTPAFLLRQSLIDTRGKHFDQARVTASTLAPEKLPPADRPWLHYLRGMLADEARDYAQAGQHYQQAEATATSPEQRSWFVLARERTRLFLGQANDATIASLRKNIESNPGRPTGHTAVSQLAVALNATNRRSEAITLLQTQLQYLAPQETATRDEWLLLLGLVAGPADNAGRDALRKLLASATKTTDPDKLRAALRLLANASRTKERSAEFLNWLSQLITATPPHPILADLLLTRAQLTLSDTANKDNLTAENDATRILAEFPGSPLRAAALGIQTGIAWEQTRYRAAADWATRARNELKTGPAYAQLGVLIAEAFYRAKDYRNASDAYGSALSDIPAGIRPGMLMFQRVLSEIQATPPGGTLANSEKILDTYAADPRFDPVNRWQAEWNLARALQAADEIPQAYARVNKLLATAGSDNPQSPLPPDLRARMAWLQTRLAYDSGNYQDAINHAEKLKTTLGDIAPDLRDSVISMTMLIEVEAGYALARPGASGAIDTAELLKKLRADYPQSTAAIRSYIVEAGQVAKHGQLVEAQGLLRKLADDHKDKPEAADALFQGAIYAELRGDQYYREAYRYLEELVTKYPQSDLVFPARLRQGNLLRNMGDERALTFYTDLVNTYKYPQYPNGLIAELALADCYNALAATDISRAESAATIYERLLDLPDAPVDLRVEAGYKFGRNLIARKTYPRLEAIWWQMINDFLLEAPRAAELGPKGRYWIARTLLDLGEVLEQQNKFPQAREAYQHIITHNLPGAALARERITRGAR